ncbi:GH92 family glycosyl hydrolase [Saccharicrinis fermentans]|uniref:Putative alpha-1,2-mannosidase n=1 Tax=Saccharicrinis fermentans DSM 9555 = JCM 21142 TaxID=869213 RepID=W7XU98_9BACT|nr:GH92 family glycosyl hydrolase [Saccharicrinis fermentans]GAF01560.1 putative alpha-1,2-mannosidase [Saccharicrinis fermentans DSM 9555 = JCM 21142]
MEKLIKNFLKLTCVGLSLISCGGPNTKSKDSKLSYVDTRVGTAASIADITVTEVEEPMGYVSPIVGYPSALTHWTPQTAEWTKRVITVPVPYWYDQDKIQGFRGTRYPNGAVVGDWGAMCVMPMIGKVRIDADARASKFSHDNEIAKPHYYSVLLDDYAIKAEYTAAAKTAFFQFTFPESSSSTVLIDGVYVPGNYRVIPERNEIEGYSVIAGHFKNYFVAKFNKSFKVYNVDLLPNVVDATLVPDGFKAEYFNNDKLEGEPDVVVTHTELNYDWLKEPVEGVVADFFSVRYSGAFVARYSGEHTFELTTKDGTRMYFDDALVIDEWKYRATGTNVYKVNLKKGEKYKIRIEYYDGSSTTEMHLRCAEPIKINPDLASQLALKGADGNAVYVTFITKEQEEVMMKVGTSLIDLSQARANMNEEFPDFDFERAVAKSADVWDNELNKIQVEGGEDDKAIFYTALTKCFVNPRNLNENGKYFSPFDFKVHEGEMYTDLSIWDTFRSLHPLWVILKPDETTNIINGMLNAYKEGGWLPKWPNPWYRSIMMGTHADAVIADAYVKGIRGFDTDLAFKAMLKNATEKGNRGFSGRVGIEYFNALGYVPADVFGFYGEPVARTLEFSYDDYCIAQMAKALGEKNKYEEFMQRSKRYMNVLDKETGLVRGKKKNGDWLAPYDKSISVWAQGSDHDTEVYYKNHTLLVPHDIPGLANFMGGQDKLEAYLDDFFANNMYYVGDEFSMHAPYMYNFISAPWKTQKTVREMLAKYFFNDVGGLPGNDDCGQVSSWYVFGAMGFYPACPGDPIYQLCSPVFDKVSMNVGEGKIFTIIANNNSKDNMYIQSATLNGKPYNKSWLYHKDLVNGGELVFELGPKPNKDWGLTQ